MRELAYRAPVLAAIFAVEAGASCAQAFRTYRAVKVATVLEVADLLTEAGIPHPPGGGGWRDAEMWELGRFLVPNWPHLARQAGEACDESEWLTAHEELEARRAREEGEWPPEGGPAA